MSFLTLFERTILEKLYVKPKTLEELTSDISIDPFIVFNTLSYLESKHLVISHSDGYAVNPLKKKIVTDLLQQDQKLMITELIHSTVESSSARKNHSFKFKQISISDEDQSIFKVMLANIESFLNDAQKRKNVAKKERIIFWGAEEYSQLLNHLSQRI